MADANAKAGAVNDASQLLLRLRRQVLDALWTARELQVPLSRGDFSFESGRVRGVIDELIGVRRTASQVLKDLKAEGGEAGHG